MVELTPDLAIYETARKYWPDIVATVKEINRDGHTFYTTNFDLLSLEEQVLTPKDLPVKNLDGCVEFTSRDFPKKDGAQGNEASIVMNIGDSQCTLFGDLYALVKSEKFGDPRIGYLKINNGVIQFRDIRKWDRASDNELIAGRMAVAMRGPITHLLKKIGNDRLEILKIKNPEW